jgi:hypothetical protein
MGIVSGIFRLIIGAVFGLGCYVALAPALAAMMSGVSSQAIGVVTIVFVVVGAIIGLLARSIRRAFGWGFLELALCTLGLPLSTMLLAGKVANDMTTAAASGDKGTTLIGSGLAGGLMTGAAAIVGFFLGAIFLIIALVLLLGGRREVILVDRASGAAVAGISGKVDTSRWSRRDREAFETRRNHQIEPPIR